MWHNVDAANGIRDSPLRAADAAFGSGSKCLGKVQGDTSRCSLGSVDMKTKVAF